MEQVLAESNKTKEIYQFYYNQPYYTNDSCELKHTKIQIQELKNIKELYNGRKLNAEVVSVYPDKVKISVDKLEDFKLADESLK